MMGILTEEWDEFPSTGLMFCQTSPQEVFKMEPITDKTKEALLYKKRNTNVMRVVDTILAAAA